MREIVWTVFPRPLHLRSATFTSDFDVLHKHFVGQDASLSFVFSHPHNSLIEKFDT
jgi:bifunctional pyridoxal-dependent enzyme with beta-cystathionase and maltose regulon repressor activities